MDLPVPDIAYSYSDVFQSPIEEEGGIYTLEEAGKNTDPNTGPNIRNRYALDLRMRGPPPIGGMTSYARPPKRVAEGFSSKAYARGSSNAVPSSTGLKSARWNRPPIDDIVWDERPRSFRPNSSNLHAELFIPPQLRPWGGGPSPYLAYPTYSPARAVSVIDGFTGDPNGAATGSSGGGISAKSIEVGLQMVKVVLFLVIVILLAMWMVVQMQSSNLRQCIREAVSAASDAKK